MIRRERLTWARVQDIEAVIPALVESARERKGLYARELPISPGHRPALMRYLRQHGVPLVAVRRGVESVWFILNLHPREAQGQLSQQWNRRILEDHYAQTCNAHMALVPSRTTKRLARQLASHAVYIGAELGYAVEEVLRDLTPEQAPEFISGLMP
jgi:hypothetical protein